MNPTSAIVIALCAATGLTAGATLHHFRAPAPTPIWAPEPEPQTVNRAGKGDMLPRQPVFDFDTPPATPEPEPVERAVPHRDPVCGMKGRTWYHKNGWPYWRCNR